MFSFWENLNLNPFFINRLCLLWSAVNVIWLLKILPKIVKFPKKKQEPLLISTIYLMSKHPRKQVRYDFFVHFGAKYCPYSISSISGIPSRNCSYCLNIRVRDHSSITSSKRWVGGVRKWQLLMIYSTVNHQRVGWVGLKKSKT